MATVPGPGHDGPLPRPGAPAEEPLHSPDEEQELADPERDEPAWLPKPYDPEREFEEPGVPLAP
jgi:hypothetical protein